jgi:hypothetical protein
VDAAAVDIEGYTYLSPGVRRKRPRCRTWSFWCRPSNRGGLDPRPVGRNPRVTSGDGVWGDRVNGMDTASMGRFGLSRPHVY